MIKYEVGDEVLVKATINDICVGKKKPYAVKSVDNKFCGDTARVIYIREEDVLPDADMTAEEAWEIAKKLFADYSNAELDEIFGKGWSFPKLMEMTPQQAKARIEAREAEKEIKVGDVITPNEGHYRAGEYGLVVCINSVNQIGVNYPGNDYTLYEKCHVKKTGRHLDIDGFLKQMGVDEQCQ